MQGKDKIDALAGQFLDIWTETVKKFGAEDYAALYTAQHKMVQEAFSSARNTMDAAENPEQADD